MEPILLWLAFGSLMILLRRSWARSIGRYQEFWLERGYDEDGLAWWLGAMGGLVVLSGCVFLAIWLFR
jgi:hypothetical protein